MHCCLLIRLNNMSVRSVVSVKLLKQRMVWSSCTLIYLVSLFVQELGSGCLHQNKRGPNCLPTLPKVLKKQEKPNWCSTKKHDAERDKALGNLLTVNGALGSLLSRNAETVLPNGDCLGNCLRKLRVSKLHFPKIMTVDSVFCNR